ncbi:glycosyltransferase family 4 protein [Nitrospira sp. Nam74]
MKQFKLLLVGPYPPPYGGIAMTVFDLQQYLLAQRACHVEVLNIGEGRSVINGECIGVRGALDFFHKVMSFARRGYFIHLETNGHNLKSWISALICSAAGYLNGRKTIIAFGSGNLPAYLLHLNRWKKLVVKAVLALAGVVICRNQNMVEAIQNVRERQDRIEIVPGFMGLHTRKLIDVPRDVKEFCDAHTPLIGATVTLAPEYGASLALQGIQRLLHKHPNLGLVLLGIGPEEANQLPGLADVREHVFLAGSVDANVSLSVMRHLGLFLRPTYFDGDSLSVREALALGIPVVASSTGLRPKGVVLFEPGQIDDLEKQLNYALHHREELMANQRNESETRGGVDLMMQIYRRLSNQ